MQLHVLNSNSDGNCYIFTDDQGFSLIVECGVKFDHIKKALDYDFKNVVGVIVTHEHGDHCKGVKDALKYGLDVYATNGTIVGINCPSHNLNPISINNLFSLGPYKVFAFKTHHNTREPCGFLIEHPEMGITLFLTDTTYCDFKFPGLNNILIECNYSETIIDKTLSDKKFLRDRVINDHMSVETAIKTLKANDLSQVNNIVLIHLSDRNSDASMFKKMIEKATGKTVTIAMTGLKIFNFNKTPF